MKRHTVLAGVGLVFAIANCASALDFEYIKVADTSTAPPGNSGQLFTSFTAPHLDGYNVVFAGASLFTGVQRSGVYVSSGGVLTKIADPLTAIPGASANFIAAGNPAISGANVVFTGASNSPGNGIYLSAIGLSSSRVVDLNSPIPGGSGNFTILSNPTISGASVGFYGQGSAGQVGIYSTAGGLHVAANTSTPVPSGTGNFTDFGILPTLRNGQVAFLGIGSGQQGLYTELNGAATKVVDTSTIPPDSAGAFTSFSNPSFDGGSVAFHAFSGGGQNGIYSASGGVNTVADITNSIPGGSGNFTSLGDNTAIDGGTVVFTGSGSGTQSGVYTNYAGLNKVVDNSTAVGGQLLTNFSISHDATSHGNFAFAFSNSASNSGIYVAEQSYDYVTGASGTWDNNQNWSFGLKPRTVVYTNIRPDNGALITGPAASTTIRGLDLGSNFNGVAELRLQPTGQLTVNESLTVEPTGKLSINGGVASASGLYNYGDIDLGGGQITGGYYFNNNSATLHGSGTVGSYLYNYGHIQAINSQDLYTAQVQNNVLLDGDNNVFATGQIDIRNALVQYNGGLSNQGHVNFSFGTSDVFGTVENVAADGVAHTPGGQIIISGNSNVTFYDAIVNKGDVFRVSAGSTAVFFGPISTTAAFTGTGAKMFEGGYTQGPIPTAVLLEGPITMGPTNTVNVKIGGTTAGTQYDQLQAAGSLSLDGALKVSLVNNFHPARLNKFNILDWNSESGAFSSLQLPALTGSLGWNTSNLYQTGVLSVVDLNLLPGDMNLDHQITTADFPLLLQALTNKATYESQTGVNDSQLAVVGDTDESGTLDNGDLQGLLNELLHGTSFAAGSAPALSADTVAVPEPPGIVLLFLAAMIVGLRPAIRRTHVHRCFRLSGNFASTEFVG